MSADQEAVVFSLIAGLRDPELTVRVHAGLLLAARGVEARPALPALLELRHSEQVPDRRLAAMVLGSLAWDLAEAVPPLLNALHDDDETVRRLAAEALEAITPTPGRRKAA